MGELPLCSCTPCTPAIKNAGRGEICNRISDMSTLLQEQPAAVTENNERQARQQIEKVTVYEDKFTV
jgi:hypothetical protein